MALDARRVDQVLGATIVGVAAFFGHGAMGMRYFTSIGPGPGFFPRWLALLLALLGAALIVRASFGRAAPVAEGFSPGRSGALRVAAVLAAVAVIALALETVGFPLIMLAASLGLMLTLGLRDARILLPVALAASFGTHLVFARWLGVQLPAGLLGF